MEIVETKIENHCMDREIHHKVSCFSNAESFLSSDLESYDIVFFDVEIKDEELIKFEYEIINANLN